MPHATFFMLLLLALLLSGCIPDKPPTPAVETITVEFEAPPPPPPPATDPPPQKKPEP